MNRYCQPCIVMALAHDNTTVWGRILPVFFRLDNHQFNDFFCTQCLSAECNVLYELPRQLPPPPQQPPRTPQRRARSPPGTPPIMQGVGLGGGFSPITQAPAGEARRKTYVLEEDCPTCFEQEDVGHRMCLQCNSSCCAKCWFKMETCPICRYNKN